MRSFAFVLFAVGFCFIVAELSTARGDATDGLVASAHTLAAACFRNGVAVGKLEEAYAESGDALTPKLRKLIDDSEKGCR